MGKANLGELEEEVRGVFSSRLRKELIRVVQEVSGNRRFLVRLQDGCEKDLTSNKLTIVTVYKSPVDEEPEVNMIAMVPNETVDLDKGCYHGVYVMQAFTEGGVSIGSRSRRTWT